MIKNLLLYIHVLACIVSAGLTLWLLNDLWSVLAAMSLGVTLTYYFTKGKKSKR
ncbi:hypothetical protein ACFPK9_10720 [Rubritalea spongiae]|uniref:DUF2269 family protein n=1 Tax=Rubritalea spongiae TaxID=430797 RepID=A0ABW5DZU7_9BACT